MRHPDVKLRVCGNLDQFQQGGNLAYLVGQRQLNSCITQSLGEGFFGPSLAQDRLDEEL